MAATLALPTTSAMALLRCMCAAAGLGLLLAVTAFPQDHKSSPRPAANETSLIDLPEDEFVDAKEPSGFSGACTLAACDAHCRTKKHDTGRCHKDTCACKDKKRNSRCYTCVASGTGNSMSENVNVNNIIVA